MDNKIRLLVSIQNRDRVQDLDLRHAVLTEANLSNLIADQLDLHAVDLHRAKFCNARLGSSNLRHARLDKSDWTNAVVRMCVLDNAFAAGACFDGARLEDSSAKGADLTGASLSGSWLTETLFERAMLCEARFDKAQGDGVDFRGADLRGAILRGANLDEADFRGANLQGADLSNSRFRDADFRGALLVGTNFAGTDVEGALFDTDQGREPEGVPNMATEPTSLDDALHKALHETLSELPGVLADRESPLAEFQEQLQQAIADMHETADGAPNEMTDWLESLTKKVKNGTTSNKKKRGDKKSPRSSNSQKSRMASNEPVDGISDNPQPFVDNLDMGEEQPPEVWRAWLEPLVEMAERGETPDMTRLLKAVAAMTKEAPLPWCAPDVDKSEHS